MAFAITASTSRITALLPEHKLAKAPAKAQPRPDFLPVAYSYLKETGGTKNLVLKPIAIGAEWWLKKVNTTSVPAENMHRLAKDAKNLTDLASVPEKGSKALSQGVKFVSDPSLSAFGDLLHKVCEMWIPVVDAAKTITSKVAPLTARAAQLLELSASTALVTAMTFGTLEEAEKINSAEKMAARGGKDQVAAEAQKANSFLAIIRNSSFQGLGGISLAAYFLGAAVPGMLMLMLATNGLAFTIFAEFHKRMVMEPAQKALLPVIRA